MVESSDAFDIATRAMAQLEMNYPSAVGFYNYGNLQNFLVWIILRPVRLAGYEVSFATTTFVLILWQLVFVALSYLALARIVSGVRLGAAAEVCLMTIPIASQGLFFWTYQIHPDILQFSLLMLFVSLFARGLPPPFLAGIILGLALGTKWQSALYVLFFLLFFPRGGEKIFWFLGQWRQVTNLTSGLMVAFATTNASFFLEIPEAIRDLRFESWHVWYGHGVRESWNPIDWIPIVSAQSLGLVFTIGVLLYFAKSTNVIPAVETGQSRAKPFFSAPRVALLVLLLGLAHLLVMVNYREARYFLYLLPAIALIAADAAHRVLEKYQGSFPWVGTIAGIQITVNLSSALFNVQEAQVRTESFPLQSQFVAGELVRTVCSEDAIVLLPMYSYLPEKFSRLASRSFWLFTAEDVARSDVILLNRKIPGVHVWTETAENEDRLLVAGDLDESPTQIDTFSKLLISPDEVGFARLYDDEEVKVFVRKDSQMCSYKLGPQQVVSEG